MTTIVPTVPAASPGEHCISSKHLLYVSGPCLRVRGWDCSLLFSTLKSLFLGTYRGSEVQIR